MSKKNALFVVTIDVKELPDDVNSGCLRIFENMIESQALRVFGELNECKLERVN